MTLRDTSLAESITLQDRGVSSIGGKDAQVETTSSAGESPVRPVNRYGPLDSPPIRADEARAWLGPGNIAILDVQPVEQVMSDQPFRLRVQFVGGAPEDGLVRSSPSGRVLLSRSSAGSMPPTMSADTLTWSSPRSSRCRQDL
jgi:hypothetical protein